MSPSFTIARIAGIRIGVNWSWLIVFALIVWTLESTVFPASNPGLSTATYVAMAVAAAILFFTSLLLHELGHALQAKRDGVEIEGITLWLFGGVARFRGMFPSAGAELRIAVAGPLVSLLLGGLFVAVAAAGGLGSAVDGVAAWLGYINLILLAFNLLPALPLDGGRVFRSLLWLRSGDFARATRVAADVGRGDRRRGNRRCLSSVRLGPERGLRNPVGAGKAVGTGKAVDAGKAADAGCRRTEHLRERWLLRDGPDARLLVA